MMSLYKMSFEDQYQSCANCGENFPLTHKFEECSCGKKICPNCQSHGSIGTYCVAKGKP